ncbi:MAG: OmpA family protein [Rhodospirillaceae bacterium]|nr:OmpA family protein [Rhodospirillaceae bacterium]
MYAGIKTASLDLGHAKTSQKLVLKLGSALVFSFGLGVYFIAMPSAAWAQESIALDYANPNVSIDFSVLDDNGPTPGISTSPIIKKGGHIVPGAKAPVSTLYITPAGNFAKIEEPTESKPAQTAMPEEPSSPIDVPTNETVAKEDIPAAPAPSVSAEHEQEPVKETPASAPELAKEEVAPPPEPAPIEPPKEIAKKEVPQEAVSEMAKAEVEMPTAPPPPPEPAPAPAPITPVVNAPAVEMPTPAKPAEVEPLKLDAQKTPEKITEKAADPISAPPPPPVVEAPKPPMVTAPLPESTLTQESEPTPSAPSVASIPPSGGTVGDGYSLRVLFEPDTAKLAGLARDDLSALVKNMGDNENLRLQLLAYAGGADMSASVARRLSLSRALAVRSYLIESGIRSTRIDVRALGNKTTDADTERVDITVIER